MRNIIFLLLLAVSANAQSVIVNAASLKEVGPHKPPYSLDHAMSVFSPAIFSGASWGAHRMSVMSPDKKYAKFDEYFVATNQVYAVGTGVVWVDGERRPWWHYVLDDGVAFAGYTGGNYLTYNVWRRTRL